ncbi:MAG: ABC transporter permease [Nocardioidaceae bacterium]|nr:ABC transporter permease [Nocardioidaceae bacterium]NUS52654.1 ABC transporter permease [Nocardioidaceae bacterium]
MFIGGLLIAATDQDTRNSLGYFFAAPGDTFYNGWWAASEAYSWLLKGAILDPATLSGGSPSQVFGSISETLVYATPVILTGLSVALAFRTGLFNIGAQGQMIFGVIFAGWVGFKLHLPFVIHLPLALLAGMLGGALYGGLVGVLKARTGAHEVITTIMLNYVAVSFLLFLLGVHGFQAPPFNQSKSLAVDDSAGLPRLFELFAPGLRANVGFILVLIAAMLVWWLLERSTIGFRLRAVGANPAASRTAGISAERAYVVAMTLAGLLAGLAGAVQLLGPAREITGTIDNGAGFDGITAALLGRGKPAGVVAAGLLFGALRAGGQRMASETGTPIDIVVVVQALTVLFIAAPALVQSIFRVKTSGGLGAEQAKGW